MAVECLKQLENIYVGNTLGCSSGKFEHYPSFMMTFDTGSVTDSTVSACERFTDQGNRGRVDFMGREKTFAGSTLSNCR